jgi:hypothetical protein
MIICFIEGSLVADRLLGCDYFHLVHILIFGGICHPLLHGFLNFQATGSLKISIYVKNYTASLFR